LWISKIELTNFKSYRHAEFNFPEPQDGKNIVLIGGINGYGKTSVLEALYLCLYGKDAIVHLARAGLKTEELKGYPSFLERAFNGEARRDSEDLMSVRVVVQKTKTKGLDILRRWYFRTSTGAWLEDEAVVREVARGVPGVPKVDQKNAFLLSELLDDHFVPAHIAPFFFFDGEEVKKLADQNRIEQVKQGLEGLLGVVLLRNLAERLKGFEGYKRSGIASVDDENIERMRKELAEGEAKLNALRLDAEQSKQKLEGFKADRASYLERITSAGGGGGDIATVKEYVEEREQLRSAQRDTQKALERILADKLPFHLMPRALLQEFNSQLEREVALTAWQSECRTLEPKRARFENAFLTASTPAISPPLTDAQVAAVKGRIETAWASLFHPPPSNCAQAIAHGYLHESLRERALAFLDSIDVGQQEVHDLLSQQRGYTARIEDLNRKISRIEGIDRDGTLADLKKNLSSVSSAIDELESRIRDDERDVIGLEVTVNNTRSRYQQETKRRDETSPVRQLLSKSERVRAVIDEVVPALFPLKVKALAAAMTRVYTQLAHKSQVARIIIDDDGSTHVLSKNNKEITFDRSAGENQIFATALIAGLAEVSKVKAPLVVDTPLGRLDSKHRHNILDFWVSDTSRQVILLSQDEEIDAGYYKHIKKNVSATYLLDHEDVGDGIGRTRVLPNKYFGGVA
jgi:DNA sulfur modification protein DndD